MSLKSFHIAFISCSVLLALGAGVWFLAAGGALALGIVSIAVGAALAVYEVRFVKKLKHQSAL
jgi:hypothetical protein